MHSDNVSGSNLFVIGECLVRVVVLFFFFQAEDGIRDLVRSRGLGDVYKRQVLPLHLRARLWSKARMGRCTITTQWVMS